MTSPTAPVAPSTPPTASPEVLTKVVRASFIGNFVEWFDYAVYGYLAASIGKALFPNGSLLGAYAVFGLAMIIRPVGGLVWGRIGDAVGRRSALSWSILIMTIATTCIALIPSYATIGLAAPILLLLIRTVQSFSASGEYAGASAFLAEYAPSDKRGLYAAVVPASTSAGLLFGLIISFTLESTLSAEQMTSWGWRLPFLIAAPMGLIGRYIRLRLEDTPIYRQLEDAQAQPTTPIGDLFRDHRRPLLIAFLAACLNAVAFYVLLSYMPTYLKQVNPDNPISGTMALLAEGINLVFYIGFILWMGRLSDRIGRKKVLIAASIGFVLFTIPSFMIIGSAGIVLIIIVQIFLSFLLTMNDGTLPVFLSELFPTEVRYTGFAFSFNLANALFGGSAAFVCTFFIDKTGSQLVPAYYLVIMALISGGAIWAARETFKDNLATTQGG